MSYGIAVAKDYARRMGLSFENVIKYFNGLYDLNKRIRISYVFPEGIPVGISSNINFSISML